MFYVMSKLIWMLLHPVMLVFLLMLLAMLLIWRRHRRSAVAALILAATGLFFMAFTNVGALLFVPLEARFPPPETPPAHVGLIVVLGGAIDGHVSASRQRVELDNAGDRFIEALALAQQYPEAKILISGGIGLLSGDAEGDAEVAERFLIRFGIARDRLVLENTSRTTAENADLTRQLLAAIPGSSGLLVTSAWHMPRAMGAFHKAGLDLIAWPVDYRSERDEGFTFSPYQPGRNIQAAGDAAKEWVGLLAYYLTGRSDTLLPSS